MKTLNPDVMIVGGGLAGCALALSLHRKGMEVLLVEREAAPRDRFKGEYLQPYAVKSLIKLGLSEIVDNDETVRIRSMRFRDLAADGISSESETLIHYAQDSYAAVMPNKDLVSKLQSHTKAVLGERFLLGAALSALNADSPDFHMSPEFGAKFSDGEALRIKPRWVVGCDGRQSTSVRRWMGGPSAPVMGRATLGASPEFIVGCELDAGVQRSQCYEVIRTSGQGTLAIFQLKDLKRRCYWSVPFTEGRNSKKDWQSQMGQLLGESRSLGIPFNGQVDQMAGASADSVWMGPAAKGRFLLAGDALAGTTPFGGQGMTCAVLHVEALASLLDEHSDRSTRSISRLGSSYASTCRKWYRHYGLLNFGLYYLFFARQPIFKATSRHILNRWNKNPEMLDRVGRLFGGDDLDTPGAVEVLRLWGALPALARKQQERTISAEDLELTWTPQPRRARLEESRRDSIHTGSILSPETLSQENDSPSKIHRISGS